MQMSWAQLLDDCLLLSEFILRSGLPEDWSIRKRVSLRQGRFARNLRVAGSRARSGHIQMIGTGGIELSVLMEAPV